MKPAHYLFIAVLILSASCSSYKQNIMFKADEYTELQSPDTSSNHFTIEPFDAVSLQVFTKDGERLIDPDFALIDQNIPNVDALKPSLSYLVQKDGTARLPMIGSVLLEGYTLREAELMLQQEYGRFYQDPYVNLVFNNKRVIMLGALGNKVIPLQNEEVRVTEVFGLAEGIDKDAKMGNIRLMRGEETYQLDFSTVAGYEQSNMVVKPNDIIYVEPVRRPFTEAIRDYGPVISLVTTVASLIVVIISLN